MPSPFPGMDPYLENPSGWMGFHNTLIVEMMAALNAQLMPAYYADSEERVYISNESDPGRKVIVPDIKVVHTGRRGRPKPARGGRAQIRIFPSSAGGDGAGRAYGYYPPDGRVFMGTAWKRTRDFSDNPNTPGPVNLVVHELGQLHPGQLQETDRPGCAALLLDDPAAELDRENLGRLLTVVGRIRCQLVVTSLQTDIQELLQADRVFHVEQGHIRAA